MHVELTVAYAEPGARGDSAGSVTKVGSWKPDWKSASLSSSKKAKK